MVKLGKRSQAACTAASWPTTRPSRRIGSRLVDGLKLRSRSIERSAVGHATPLSRQRRAGATQSSTPLLAPPTPPPPRPATGRPPPPPTPPQDRRHGPRPRAENPRPPP